MGLREVEYDGKNKIKNMPVGDLDTSDQGWCEYCSVGVRSKTGPFLNRCRILKTGPKEPDFTKCDAGFVSAFVSESTELLQNGR